MADREKYAYVMVTGGGAYDGFDFNPAADIRDLLPPLIPRPGRRSIKVLRYPIDTPCTYEFGIKAMDAIWSGKAVGSGEDKPTEHVDFALHMGLRPNHTGYCIETHARKVGYKHAGEDGLPYPTEMIENGGPWAKLPDTLHSDFDIQAMRNDIASSNRDVDVTVSPNAGLYFCEFELWSSLANSVLKHGHRNAIFFHVPNDRTATAIEKGALLAVEIIKAAIAEIEARQK